MKEKRSNITIYDVATTLNISVATVNRALNNKPRVSPETKRRVEEVVSQLGYRANPAAQALARKLIKIGVIISGPFPYFRDEILKGMYSALEELKDFNFNGIFHVLISTSESEKNAEIKSVMKNMVDEGYSGIILLPNIDTRGIADLIKELKTQNVFVATIVSDIPQSERVFTVKGDGLSAGKMAAELMWWFCGKNPIAIFSGNSAVEIHKENLLGIEAMQNRFPLDILKVYENQDDAMIAYYATENLLREFPNVAGIYINSFNSITVCQKVIEAGLAGKIKIVTTDVSPEILDLIDKGVISATIFQNPYKQGKMAFRKLCDYITKSREGYGDILITPQIVMNSNKEHYSYNIIE